MFLDGSALLVDQRTGSAHALNVRGVEVWRLADGKRSRATIAATLARRHRAEPRETAGGVSALVSDLVVRGLLEGARLRERARREYELLGVRSAVVSDDPRVLTYLDRLESQLRPRGAREPDVIYEVERADGSLRIRSRGVLLREARAPLDAATALERLIVDEAMERDRSRLHVHAAALAGRRATVLLPAGHRAGKTTLALAARGRGLRLYADDIVALEPRTWRPVPVPRSVHVPDDGRPRLRRIGLRMPRSRRVGTFIEAAVFAPWPDRVGPPVRHIVLPRIAPGNASRIEPCPTAQAAAELIGCSRDLQRTSRFGADAVRELFTSARSWTLRIGDDLEEAAGLVASLAG